MAAVRLNVLSLVVLLLMYGLWMENHQVVSLNGAVTVSVNGASLIEAATWEGFALFQDTLVSEYPPTNQWEAPDAASILPWGVRQKDCRT